MTTKIRVTMMTPIALRTIQGFFRIELSGGDGLSDFTAVRKPFDVPDVKPLYHAAGYCNSATRYFLFGRGIKKTGLMTGLRETIRDWS
jgi:hypothetical protein